MPYRRPKVLFVLLAVLTVPPTLAPSARADPAIHNQLLRSTGWVVAPKGQGYHFATCWVADLTKRWVVTSQHVVGDAGHLWVYFPLKEKGEVLQQSVDYLRKQAHIRGRVIARDKKRDLALVQLDRMPADIKVLPLADKGPRPGQKVYFLGNCGMAQKKIHEGTLWHFREGMACRLGFAVWTLSVGGERVEARTIDATTGAAPGDSGAALVDAKGKLVGVVSSYEGQCSKNIEISEVRTFLHNARGETPAPQSPLDGSWTVFYRQEDGCEYCFSLTFSHKGEAHWEGEKDFTGRFTYKQGVLHIDIPGLELREDWTLRWQGDNCFTFLHKQIRHSCSRR